MSRSPAQTAFRRSLSNTVKGASGNLVEWYDVYVYAVFASSFETEFFAPGETNSQLYIWAIFAVTFLMRPIGSWFFGRYADRHGRRAALTLSIATMAGCSLVIALTPTQQSIGAAAAVVLVLCRLVQGFATGGEYGTSATYMSETALPGRRGFLSSFQYVTLIGGHVLAQLTLLTMLLTLPAEAISGWGWRVAFGIGAAGALVVLWMRRSMDESLDGETIDAARTGGAKRAGSVRELFVSHGRPLLLCFLVTMGGTLAFYAFTINGPKMVQQTFGDGSPVTGAVVNVIALTVLMLLQPLGGWLSDVVGRKALLVFFGIGGVVYTWVLYTFLPTTTSAPLALLILFGAFVIVTGYTSINAVVKAELFPVHVRALGVGLGYAVANSVFGGTAPLLYSAAVGTHAVPFFVGYVTVTIGLSLLVYVFALRDRPLTWLDDAATLERLPSTFRQRAVLPAASADPLAEGHAAVASRAEK